MCPNNQARISGEGQEDEDQTRKRAMWIQWEQHDFSSKFLIVSESHL